MTLTAVNRRLPALTEAPINFDPEELRMSGNQKIAGTRVVSKTRIAAWTFAVILFLLPFTAALLTDEMQWSVGDFITWTVMILAVAIPLELVSRKSGSTAYRAGTAIALITAILLFWVNGAVGIIGSESNPLNQMFLGVILIGAAGAALAGFRPSGLAVAMYVTAGAQALTAAVTLIIADTRAIGAPGLVGVTFIILFFAALFAAAGLQFRQAARSKN